MLCFQFLGLYLCTFHGNQAKASRIIHFLIMKLWDKLLWFYYYCVNCFLSEVHKFEECDWLQVLWKFWWNIQDFEEIWKSTLIQTHTLLLNERLQHLSWTLWSHLNEHFQHFDWTLWTLINFNIYGLKRTLSVHFTERLGFV